MSEVWVANASPIIALAKAGHLRLLTEGPDELLIPEVVAQEVLNGPAENPARQALEGGMGPFISPQGVSTNLLEWGLGPGETDTLAVALERRPCIAVLDDAAARTCAKSLGVPVMGTLAVVLRARKRKLIPSASEVFKALRAAGFYLEDETIRSVVQGIGETWD